MLFFYFSTTISRMHCRGYSRMGEPHKSWVGKIHWTEMMWHWISLIYVASFWCVYSIWWLYANACIQINLLQDLETSLYVVDSCRVQRKSFGFLKVHLQLKKLLSVIATVLKWECRVEHFSIPVVGTPSYHFFFLWHRAFTVVTRWERAPETLLNFKGVVSKYVIRLLFKNRVKHDEKVFEK